MLYILLILSLYGTSLEVFDQSLDKDLGIKLEQFILENNLEGSYLIKDLSSNTISEYKVSFLGSIEDESNSIFKFIYKAYYFGLYEDSKRCNSKIIIYKNGLRYGEYHIGGNFNTPPYMKDSKIIITPNQQDGDLITELDLSNGLPDEIFILSKEVFDGIQGDTYYLEKY